MKLGLTFNGAKTIWAQLQPVVAAAGTNTTITMNTSQTWSSSDLAALVAAAASKNLVVDFNGDQTILSLIRPLVAASGANTTVSMNTAQVWSSGDLVSLAQAGAAKKLSLTFNGDQTLPSLIQSFVSAMGANSAASMNTSQTWTSANLVSLAQAAGTKKLTTDFNGDQTILSLIQPVVTAAGANTTVSMNTAQTWTSGNLVALAQAGAAKKLSLTFNGAQTLPALIQSFISAMGANSAASMNTSQTWTSANLVSLAQAAGTKTLTVDFNGDQTILSLIQPVVSAEGTGSKVTMNTSQTWTSGNLVSLVQSAGAKKLTMDFNGAQSLASLLQPVIAAAGANTTITVNTAQALSSGDLVSLVTAAG